MTNNTTRRVLTSSKVLSFITGAIIPTLGSNKLKINGTGNAFVRDNGTAIHIFNVAAFATKADGDAALKLWVEGTKLEKSGDVEGAQEKFREALNKQMSFSVLAENAYDFQQAFEITCSVDEITTADGRKVIGINKPRAVVVEASGQSMADLAAAYLKEVEEPTETPAQKKARLKAEKAAKAGK